MAEFCEARRSIGHDLGMIERSGCGGGFEPATFGL
jgi:hypothetical protein